MTDARELLERGKKARQDLDHPSFTKNATEDDGRRVGPIRQGSMTLPNNHRQQDLPRRLDAQEVVASQFPHPPPEGGIPFERIHDLVQQVLDFQARGRETRTEGESQWQPTPGQGEGSVQQPDKQLALHDHQPNQQPRAPPPPLRASAHPGGEDPRQNHKKTREPSHHDVRREDRRDYLQDDYRGRRPDDNRRERWDDHLDKGGEGRIPVIHIPDSQALRNRCSWTPHRERSLHPPAESERAGSSHPWEDPERDALKRRIEELERHINRDRGAAYEDASRDWSANPPFSQRFKQVVPPRDFKYNPTTCYDGSTDPQEHLDTFRAAMLMLNVEDLIRCKVFLVSLTGVARTWPTK